jgi:UDP-N-acetylglucosamine/UDP-N-acetylgalactosamine diphosphorylase
MGLDLPDKIGALLKKGVVIPAPYAVEIGDDVDLDRISGDGVVIHAGCKIYGSSTLILQGSKLGYEGPVTVDNCQIGPNVQLNGGFFKEAVFLNKASAGFGAHIREGTIFEEEASVAHTVGLKQTILFPFVTLGSLINFCDCFMAGGTDRNNHSEVGSSFIHFNYTPNQDKATPSLIGDVPGGVMLNRPPIFLGGQGGLVGPCRLAYGIVTAAGTINRKDELRTGRLIFGGGAKGGNIPFTPGVYRSEKRIVINNIIYIANLIALGHWYHHVRSMFVSEQFPKALLDGLQEKLSMAIGERIRRLGELSLKLPDTGDSQTDRSGILIRQRKELFDRWPELSGYLEARGDRAGDNADRDRLLETINSGIDRSGREYINTIQRLPSEAAVCGTLWLQGIVDSIIEDAFEIIPSFEKNIHR